MDDTTVLFQPQPNDQGHEIELLFDEEKCRNVLVRYCAHIPRNYQYRDGIRLVFLVLRDHLGDECLGLAGGVLYELIEVDCQHTDDPGATFQRWKHDHMKRHVDLELPHIPHLTTVTSNITPTDTLIRWRESHPERYLTRLSDHTTTRKRSSTQTSGLRTRKNWMIDYTMYVSSRDDGTRPFRRVSAKEFHEMQWKSDFIYPGRLIGEKSIDLSDISWTMAPEDEASPGHCPDLKAKKDHDEIMNLLRKAFYTKKFCFSREKTPWMKDAGVGAGETLRGMLQSRSSLRVNEWDIPNAIFARKFGLYKDSRPLPPSIKELPVAEEKAMDIVTSTPLRRGIMYSWNFQGPYTPQLWFDSGLDYRGGVNRYEILFLEERG